MFPGTPRLAKGHKLAMDGEVGRYFWMSWKRPREYENLKMKKQKGGEP